jgi:hypothetical protein
MFFDKFGRFNCNLIAKNSYKNTRNYFTLESDIKKKIILKNIYKNSVDFFNEKIQISYEVFENKINFLINKISNEELLKNLNNCVYVPFLFPKLKEKDLGKNIKNIFIPSLVAAYKKIFPNYLFVNHYKDELENSIIFTKESRYENFLKNTDKEDTIGILYLSLNEFSFPESEFAIKKLPEIFNLSGGYEIMSALIGVPNLLFKKDKYPPLLWFSSLRKYDDENIGFHIEPYGYNLTFNKRAHLNLSAEYWWHSITVK